MSYLHTNGIRLAYQRSGQGDPVLLIMGTGAAGHVWSLHQTPALHRAGYQTVTFNNRGIPPSDAPAGRYSLADMVADTRGLIEALDLAPCRIVGTSMGALVAQELAIGWPGLVRCAVLIATRASSDAIRRAQVAAERALLESGVRVPPAYDAFVTALQMLSPATLDDDAAVSSWLEILELAGHGDGAADGQAWVDTLADRREVLRGVAAPCRVIAFTDDLVAPPHLCAGVAEAIPDCDFVEISRCGHLGYLERPHEVNTAIIEFLDKH
ncbi:alpha/beta fold hydrolase [Plantactinospora soyae]|uniref:Pimeloyl-ACP methyl ester carboxylesterase n=1 Tax=Plantactinospora soyae TaxID=1544732 RepID=A0A927M929_9ACTN|nr:alpha/beta hydrolase [Plantactinospora soyae]MBE1489185.1 pimeloyl-ACP methyl ester carboxylesterase [Plantactinospora soyae]